MLQLVRRSQVQQSVQTLSCSPPNVACSMNVKPPVSTTLMLASGSIPDYDVPARTAGRLSQHQNSFQAGRPSSQPTRSLPPFALLSLKQAKTQWPDVGRSMLVRRCGPLSGAADQRSVDIILRHAATVAIQIPEGLSAWPCSAALQVQHSLQRHPSGTPRPAVYISPRVSCANLRSGFAVPARGLGIILWHSLRHACTIPMVARRRWVLRQLRYYPAVHRDPWNNSRCCAALRSRPGQQLCGTRQRFGVILRKRAVPQPDGELRSASPCSAARRYHRAERRLAARHHVTQSRGCSGRLACSAEAVAPDGFRGVLRQAVAGKVQTPRLYWALA